MDNCYIFDILKDDFSVLGCNSNIVLFRVSTEFNRKQWLSIFERMFDGGMESVIFIPTGLDIKYEMRNERIGHIKNTLKGYKDTFCGWLYSEDEFLRMFIGNRKNPLYNIDCRIPFENTAVYFLSRNKL